MTTRVTWTRVPNTLIPKKERVNRHALRLSGSPTPMVCANSARTPLIPHVPTAHPFRTVWYANRLRNVPERIPSTITRVPKRTRVTTNKYQQTRVHRHAYHPINTRTRQYTPTMRVHRHAYYTYNSITCQDDTYSDSRHPGYMPNRHVHVFGTVRYVFSSGLCRNTNKLSGYVSHGHVSPGNTCRNGMYPHSRVRAH